MWWHRRPSNEHDWSPDQAVLPYGEQDGDLVRLFNIRDCAYHSRTEYDVRYRDVTVNLEQLKRIWYGHVPFSRFFAHAFISFEFSNTVIALSVEIRKRRGQRFSPIKGCFRTVEIMYVLADERDLVRLRTNHRREQVYLYPLRVPAEFARAVFLHIIQRVNRLRSNPEFYNTFTNSCANNLRRHANAIAPGTIPWSAYLLFTPGLDRFLYNLGYIDDPLPLRALRKKYLLNGRVLAGDDDNFSQLIRTFG